MIKNRIVIIYMFLFCLCGCVSQPKRFLPLENNFLQGIDSFKLFELNKNFEETEYVDECVERHNNFVSLLDKTKDNPTLIGKWILKDSQTNNAPVKNSFYTGNSFAIEKNNSFIEYHHKSNISVIYTNGKDFYFYPSVHFSFLKKIVLVGDELYFYILKDDKWILDPIHEDGKYFYKKTDNK